MALRNRICKKFKQRLNKSFDELQHYVEKDLVDGHVRVLLVYSPALCLSNLQYHKTPQMIVQLAPVPGQSLLSVILLKILVMLSNAARAIANQAKQKAMWIYDPTYHKWYSPEDFKHIFHFANADNKWLAQLQIRHPKDGIEAGFKRLADVHTRLQGFIKSVMAYYKT